MANDDVIVRFRADLEDARKDIESLKKAVTDLGNSTEKTNSKVKKTKAEFNGLGNSINQLTRELPAFTYSAQTGFLALSNNIPALADQIQMLKVKNQELVASGQKAIPVWKSLTSALFSWQTALSFGITLVVLYGKEIGNWIGSLFNAEKALNRTKEVQNALNKVTEKAIENSLKEKTELNILLGIARDTTNSYEQRKNAVDKLQKLYPTFLGNLSDEKIMTGDVTKEVNGLTVALLKRARAESAVAEIVENENQIKILNNKLRATKSIIELEKERLKNIKSTSGGISGVSTQELSIEANITKQKREQKTIEENIRTLNEVNNRLLKEGAEGTKELLEAEEDMFGSKDDLTEREKILKRIAELEVKIQNAVILKGKANDKDKDALRDQLNLLNQIDDEYERIMLTIGDVSRMSFINKDNIEEFKKRARDVVKAEREIQLKANEDKTKDHAEQLKKESEDYKAFMRKKWDLEIQQEKDFKALLADSATNLSNSYLDITGNFVQSQIDGITTAKEANIQQIDELLERGIISQKQYDDKKTKLEREADSRTRDLLIKQFEREKAVKTAQAIMDGVLAVQKAYAELGPVFGLPAAIAIGVVSAANVVAIQTQPLPKFEKGGWVKGKRHRDGGVLIEAEDKEFINNRISSQKYSEELESMNNLSFEKLNYRKHIMPAIRKEREKIYSAINSSFNDSNLLMSDRETRQILRDIRDGVKQNSGYSKSLRFK